MADRLKSAKKVMWAVDVNHPLTSRKDETNGSLANLVIAIV